jgi:hypothetical protein
MGKVKQSLINAGRSIYKLALILGILFLVINGLLGIVVAYVFLYNLVLFFK